MKRESYEEARRQKGGFARDLRLAAVRRGIEPKADVMAKLVGCTRYTAEGWLLGETRPARSYGPKVLEVFGVDSREYGAGWRMG